jgi:2-oxoglutarate ferredoxin oxidoreductase subunit alpha
MNKKAAKNEAQATSAAQEKIINDFSMVIATVNGSGSQTANLALIRALFHMGIPVSGKNLFPSNIKGMPTYFTVRANKDGFTARRDKMEILIGMNPETFDEDLNDLVEGGVCFYPDQFEVPEIRDDVVFYPVPVKQIIKEQNPPRKLVNYMRNMVYVGVVSEMLGIEIGEIREALETHFKGRDKAIELNMQIVDASALWARENLAKEDKYVVERDNQTEGMIMLDGNTAGALGTIFGGITFIAWYPITPGSSLAEALQSNLPRLRKGDRYDCWRWLGGGESNDHNLWPGPLSDGRIGRPCLLHGNPNRYLGCTANGTEHRFADAHISGGHSFYSLLGAWRYTADHADTWKYRGVF